MAVYPSTIDTFTTHAIGDTIDPAFDNAQQVAIFALETKLGVTNSADTSSVDYKLFSTLSIDPGHKHNLSVSLADVLITSVSDGQALLWSASSSKWVNSTSSTPDASATLKGISKMSVAPVVANTPIAVGDNDPRVPTQGENDALVGTSGTPSSSNKYVTDADTTATPTANKVMRFTSLGITPGLFNANLFGDGSDGAVTISVNTTLTRDMYYTNLTINSGVTINTAGYKIFGTGTFTNNNATNGIVNNGSDAVTNTGGIGAPAGSMKGGTNGGASSTNGSDRSGAGGGGAGIVFISFYNVAIQGGIQANGGNASTAIYSGGTVVGNNGSNGGTVAKSLGAGAGGNGGTGGPTTGGTGGTNSSVSATIAYRVPAVIFPMVDWLTVTALGGGAGGASGGYSNLGTNGAGGGGGGGGGTILFFYKTMTTSGTLTVTGGTATTFSGTGTAGTNGSAGTAYQIQLI